jgi:hypothetical protein
VSERPLSRRDGDRTARTLRDLVAFSDMAERLVARGRPAYDSDEHVRLAAEAVLHKIGEAVAGCPMRSPPTIPRSPGRL